MEVLDKIHDLETKIDFLIDCLDRHEEKEVYTTKEAAEYLRISDDFLRRGLVQKGKIRYKKKGLEYLFRREWLDDWMEYGE